MHSQLLCRSTQCTLCSSFLLSFTNRTHRVSIGDMLWSRLMSQTVMTHSQMSWQFILFQRFNKNWLPCSRLVVSNNTVWFVQIYPLIFAVIQSEVPICCDSPVKWIRPVMDSFNNSDPAGDNDLSAFPRAEDLSKVTEDHGVCRGTSTPANFKIWQLYNLI